MVSVTLASRPSTRSALVGTDRPAVIFFTSGRVSASAAADTTTNATSCTQIPAPRRTAISAARAPATNQMETSPAVAASTTPKSTMAPSQIQIIKFIVRLLTVSYRDGLGHCITAL